VYYKRVLHSDKMSEYLVFMLDEGHSQSYCRTCKVMYATVADHSALDHSAILRGYKRKN
jgi:hypothetical protein